MSNAITAMSNRHKQHLEITDSTDYNVILLQTVSYLMPIQWCINIIGSVSVTKVP